MIFLFYGRVKPIKWHLFCVKAIFIKATVKVFSNAFSLLSVRTRLPSAAADYKMLFLPIYVLNESSGVGFDTSSQKNKYLCSVFSTLVFMGAAFYILCQTFFLLLPSKTFWNVHLFSFIIIQYRIKSYNHNYAIAPAHMRRVELFKNHRYIIW